MISLLVVFGVCVMRQQQKQKNEGYFGKIWRLVELAKAKYGRFHEPCFFR